MWIWTRIKNIGGNPDEEADLREDAPFPRHGESAIDDIDQVG